MRIRQPFLLKSLSLKKKQRAGVLEVDRDGVEGHHDSGSMRANKRLTFLVFLCERFLRTKWTILAWRLVQGTPVYQL